MLRYLIGTAFAAVFLLSSFLVEKQPAAKTARENYQQYCSSCHGEKVEAFVDR